MRRSTMTVALIALCSTTLLGACGARQVEVRSAPTTTSADATIRFTNNLSQAVNVYAVTGATEVFVKQVNANGTESLAVRGVTAGSSVRLKATTVDGTKTYTKDNVVLGPSATWQVP